MKILHVDDYYMPWLGYDVEMARIQQELGHQVWFAGSNRLPPEKSGMVRPDQNGATPVNGTALRSFAIGGRIVLLPGILRVLSRFRPDVVHCHSMFELTSVLLALCKPVFRYHLIYCCHASDLNTDTRSTRLRRTLHWLFRHTAALLIKASASHIVAVGENEKTMIARELSIAPEKVPIVRLGAPVAQLKVDPAVRARERAKLGIGEADVVFISAGTLAPRKGIHDLIEAAARLGNAQGNIRLLIVGGGDSEYIASLEELAQTRQIAGQVQLTGHVDKAQLHQYYATADVGVWPGDISIATLEAMAAGLPLVLMGNDPYREVLISRDNGFSFPPGDLDALADCISTLVQNQEQRLKMGQASLEFARSEFDWSSIARKFLQLYGQAKPILKEEAKL